MVILSVRDIAGSADTSDQGAAVRDAVQRAMRDGAMVAVSFAGVRAATSSFVNVAFVSLLDTMAFDDLKRRLTFTDSSRQINTLIKDRLNRTALAA